MKNNGLLQTIFAAVVAIAVFVGLLIMFLMACVPSFTDWFFGGLATDDQIAMWSTQLDKMERIE